MQGIITLIHTIIVERKIWFKYSLAIAKKLYNYEEIHMKHMDQRKMLFLYPPNLEVRDIKKVKDMMTLSSNLNFIINEVNDFIRRINDSYLIKRMQSLPKVECSPVSDNAKLINEFQNVRICLVKYNNVDYSSSYDKIIKMYRNGQQDISHLISLTIDSGISEIRWNNDPKREFDANIETNLNKLKIVLISIMMDIILYRHFNLSSDLVKRKEFSIIKRDYVLDVYKNNGVQKVYQNNQNELRNTQYLSLCFPRVSSYLNLHNIEPDRLISELITDYWKLITQFLFINIELRDNYIMYDGENRYKSFSKDIQLQISDVIPDYCNSHKVGLPLLVAIKKDSNNMEDCHIIKTIEDFICLSEDDFNFFNLNNIEV